MQKTLIIAIACFMIGIYAQLQIVVIISLFAIAVIAVANWVQLFKSKAQ